MLVLSRKEGEKLVIGDNITLVVSKISGNRVTLGIEAPADVKIFRGELSSSTTHQPRVVPLRRAATVTIDLEDINKLDLEKLLAICGRRGRTLVLIQNSPDPDAIASAAAIRAIVRQRLQRRVEIGYGGMLGRAENRAMVEELGIQIHRFVPGDLDAFRTICLVDTQPQHPIATGL